MIALMLYLLSMSTTSPAGRRCEEHGPRLDGTYVTICNGSVVRVRDRLGNVREWYDQGATIVLRSPGAAPRVVSR
jgi:hypothetical protein